MTVCPHCRGDKKVFVFVDGRHEDGTPFSRNGLCDCRTCKGAGTITAEHAARIEAGNQRRLERVAKGVTLLEAARQAGISPSELSAIESGRAARKGGAS